MEYLKIRRGKSHLRADGSRYAVPMFVKKPHKHAAPTSTQTISNKKPIMVTGAHDAGKTRWLTRLHERALEIWGAKYKTDPLYLDSLSPLSAWVDSPGLPLWWDKAQTELPEDDRILWKSLKQHARADALPDYCRETRAVLFIDDAHKLAGKKLQLARQCVMASRVFVIATSEEQRLPPNLRSVVMRRKPQIFRLGSEVAYDATHILMWGVIAGCLVVGWWEAAVVLGGLKALGTGRRAARAD